ncbi:MAG: cobalamin biosynthesis protein CbiG, partial [Candidatus Latescibacterota bacterium]
MKLAIFALTKRGSELGRRLSRLLPQSRLFLPEKLSREGESSFQNLRQALAEAFGEYETLVLIMATGIAVRLLAPLLRGKGEDPGVVVMDERGRFAISLLGGHSRGANELARKLAFLSGGESVITTASDVNEIPPID